MLELLGQPKSSVMVYRYMQRLFRQLRTETKLTQMKIGTCHENLDHMTWICIFYFLSKLGVIIIIYDLSTC